jgi:hypothetical protein
MISQSNVTHMLVGKDTDLLTAAETRNDLAVGQIGVFLVGSKTAKTDALSAGDRFTVAYKNSKGVVVETPVIEYDYIKDKSAVTYTAPTQRSRAIGYNGTSGSIDAINNNEYVTHIFWRDNSKTFGRGIPVKFAAYYSSDSATQIEIADGLAVNFNKNFARENPPIIKAEILLSDAGAAVTGTGNLKVVNGSKYVQAISPDGGTTPPNAGAVLSVGGYLRFGTATTDPVYKVTAIDTVNEIITLNMPYQGDSEVVAEASAEYIASAAAASAAAGVKLTALPLTDDFQAGVIRYDVTEFTIELKDEFGSTTLSELAAPSVGAGTYWEVAQNEWFLKGNRGEPFRVADYPVENVLEATSGKVYDQVTFSYVDKNARSIDSLVSSFGNVMIATEDESVSTVHTDLKTVLGLILKLY